MNLQDKLLEDLKAAMRAHDETRVSVIRMVRSAIKYAEIDQHKPLDDAGVLSVIEKDVKRHRDSIEGFTKGKRQDLVTKEEAELQVLLAYLPQQMPREDVVAAARAAVAEVGAKSMADMGKVMGTLSPRLKGKADGRLISQVVQELLR